VLYNILWSFSWTGASLIDDAPCLGWCLCPFQYRVQGFFPRTMRVPETSSRQHLTAFEAKIGRLVVAIFQIQKFYVICARGIISHDLGPVADTCSKHWGGRLLLGGRGVPLRVYTTDPSIVAPQFKICNINDKVFVLNSLAIIWLLCTRTLYWMTEYLQHSAKFLVCQTSWVFIT
jgi:hypothetical protein